MTAGAARKNARATLLFFEDLEVALGHVCADVLGVRLASMRFLLNALSNSEWFDRMTVAAAAAPFSAMWRCESIYVWKLRIPGSGVLFGKLNAVSPE